MSTDVKERRIIKHLENVENIFLSTINYCGKEYCIIPYHSTDACYCVAENAIILIYMERTHCLYNNGAFESIVMLGREAFTNKMISQKNPFNELSAIDRKFIHDALELSIKLNNEIEKNLLYNQKISRLKKLVMAEFMERKLEDNILSEHLSSLTGKNYIIEKERIIREGMHSNIFTFCMDVYSTFKGDINMGIFDSFYSQNAGSNKFLSYVHQMSGSELIRNIESEYTKIKGNSRKAPRMGEFGSFEFAGALLLWKYLKGNLRKPGANAMAEVLINLGSTIGCAYFCMPAGEWSDEIDTVINSASDILSYAEWSDVYNYLKENYADEIHVMEFHKGLCSDLQAISMYREFIAVYNSLQDFNSVLDYYSEQNLNIKGQLPFNIQI